MKTDERGYIRVNEVLQTSTAGLIKILVDRDTKQFLGAAVLDAGGDEVINMFTTFISIVQSVLQGNTYPFYSG